MRGEVKLNFRPCIRRYTSPNENVEYATITHSLNEHMQLSGLAEVTFPTFAIANVHCVCTPHTIFHSFDVRAGFTLHCSLI